MSKLYALIFGPLAVCCVSAAVFAANLEGAAEREVRLSGFVGYARGKIEVKFSPFALKRLKAKDLPRGLTRVAELDKLGRRFGVKKLKVQFPGAVRREYRGRIVDLAGWHKIYFPESVDVHAVAAAYRKLPVVLEAWPVGIQRINRTPYEQFYDWQWHLPKMKADKAWCAETGNPDIIVAMLDTGVRYYAKDLGGSNASADTPWDADGNMWVNWAEKNGSAGVDDDGNGYVDDWIGWDFVADTNIDGPECYPGEDCDTADNDPRDFNGHGTHCAGSIAAINNNGEAVASVAGGWGSGVQEPTGNGVKVMALRVGWSAIDFFYEVGLVEMDYAAQALHYAADNGARIASCSWGSENAGAIADALDYFLASGGLVFKAAGNADSDVPDYLEALPGRQGLVSVAATDQDDCKAIFSNYGSWVDIAAPGVAIYSLIQTKWPYPDDDYVDSMNGTSMATPLAAAVAALVWSGHPDWSADAVRQRLLDSADPIDHLSCNTAYAGLLGAGRLNALAVAPAPGFEDLDRDGDIDGTDLSLFLGASGDQGISTGDIAAGFGTTDCP